MRTVWEDSSTATYTADSTTVGDLTVTVCLDDEGPLRPAFYWDIERHGQRVTDGWASSVMRARIDSLVAAQRLNREFNS